MVGQAAVPPQNADYGYGKRPDGSNKGRGYFGELKRPDGDVSTEISVGVHLDGKETEIPLLVPTLSRAERDKVLSLGPKDKIPDSIMDKAIAHARQRKRAGKSPFAGPGDVVAE